MSSILHCRMRYFDPLTRRAGVPEDVAALVEKLGADSAELTLVNIDQVRPRAVTVQSGGYAEHRFVSVSVNGKDHQIDDTHFTVQLAPGAGCKIIAKMQRYVNQPTLMFPWDRP
jgi:hypothetical protein